MGSIRSAVFMVVLAACDAPQSDAPKVDEPPPKARPAPASSCMPAGLEAAKPVEVVRLPAGCSITATGTITAPTVIRTLDEYTAALECPAGVDRPTIDFTTHQLQLASFMLSPAYGGSEVVDDGTLITFVQRDRSPCPDDPQPMPTPGSLAYLLPQGAERTRVRPACALRLSSIVGLSWMD